MEHISLSSIVCPPIPDDAEVKQIVEELASSIKENGLFHPVRVHPMNTDPPTYKVTMGKKRVWAIASLGLSEIPCEVKTEESEEKARQVTIEENLRRYNLPWWEQAKLVSEWHELKQVQLGKSASHRPEKGKEKTGWSMRDTADALAISLGMVSESALLSKAVERDPSLRNIKDRATAVKLVRSASKRIEGELMAAAPVEFDVNQVYNGPSAEILKRFPKHSFDAVITDPPWLKYKDGTLTKDDETMPVFKELFRVMRPDSFLYAVMGFDDFFVYRKRLPDYGFTVSNTPLIWVKSNFTLSKGVRAWEYSRDFELILLAVKGSPALVSSVQQSSILQFQQIAPIKLTHPHEKPISLITTILEDCTHPGSVILDPFGGSGAHLEAALVSGRRYVGIERDHETYEKIVKRLEATRERIKNAKDNGDNRALPEGTGESSEEPDELGGE